MPNFCLDDYERLLSRLLEGGYSLLPVEEMPQAHLGSLVFLRHDVDLHITGIERIAEVESGLGVASTFYIPLTLHFNPAYPENRDILVKLVSKGHRIGLHYDLQTYPWDEQTAWEHLGEEAASLSALVGSDIQSICMHNPWEGREDIFREGSPYVHPHDPRYAEGVVYVSDSCRAWRDETLLLCFGAGAPRRLLLNTHPELWLGEACTGREEFARKTLLANVVRQHGSYVTEVVIPGWSEHPAPARHDERERGRVVPTGPR